MKSLKGKVTRGNTGIGLPSAKRLKEEGAQAAIASLSPRTLCDEYVIKTPCFLNNGLQGHELEDFCAHLASYADCRFHLEAERATSQTLNRSRPLYSAPAVLRTRLLSLMRAPQTMKYQYSLETRKAGTDNSEALRDQRRFRNDAFREMAS